MERLTVKVERARATFDWEPTGETQLALTKGDVVTVLSRCPSNPDSKDAEEWWEGELNGAVGYFPAAYVERIPAEDALARVLFDYDEAGDDAVALKAGTICALLDVSADDWWLVGVDDKIGWFPAAYLKVLQDSEIVAAVPTPAPTAAMAANSSVPQGDMTSADKSARRAMWRKTMSMTAPGAAVIVDEIKKKGKHKGSSSSKRHHRRESSRSKSPSAPSNPLPPDPTAPPPPTVHAAPPTAPLDSPETVPSASPPCEDKEKKKSSSGSNDKRLLKRIDLMFSKIEELKTASERTEAKLDQVLAQQKEITARLNALDGGRISQPQQQGMRQAQSQAQPPVSPRAVVPPAQQQQSPRSPSTSSVPATAAGSQQVKPGTTHRAPTSETSPALIASAAASAAAAAVKKADVKK